MYNNYVSNGPNLLDDKFNPKSNNLFLYLIFILVSLVISVTIILLNQYNRYGYNLPIEQEPRGDIKEPEIRKVILKEEVKKDDKDRRATLIYPIGDAPIVGELNISGVVSQNPESLLLDTIFRKDVYIPSYGGTYNIIDFIPGKLKADSDIVFFLKERRLFEVYGFAQWPQILCNIDQDTFEKCLENRKGDIPPVVYFIKERNVPTSGFLDFTVSLDKGPLSETLLEKSLYFSNVNTGDYLDSYDSCSLGYYYEKDFLATPPVQEIVGYRVLFPNEETSVVDMDSAVYIKLGGQLFDLVIPSAEELIGYSEPYQDRTRLIPNHNLFLPLDYLYYKNGQKAEILDFEDAYYGEYFEYVLVNRNSLEPMPDKIVRRTSTSSGCDG